MKDYSEKLKGLYWMIKTGIDMEAGSLSISLSDNPDSEKVSFYVEAEAIEKISITFNENDIDKNYRPVFLGLL